MENYLIDTHCHLDFPDFDGDRDEVILRAYEGGVEKMINIGCNLERAEKSIELAEKYDFVFTAVGLHPQEADFGNEKFFAELEKILKESKVVAVGECGLEQISKSDFDISRSPTSIQREQLPPNIEKQKKVFQKQLELAGKYKKPVVIHCRRAYPEILEILEKEKEKNPELSGVIHCFVGRLSQAEEFIKLGFLVSFTGMITYARDYDKVIKNIPLEKITIETDAPFIAPAPFRGKRNEPLYVKYAAEKIAELKGLSFEETARATTKNAEKLFGI